MPKVGKKHFPYTPAGIAAAKKAEAKHERTESKAEKRAEYGPARKPKPKKKGAPKRTSAVARKNNMDK